MTYQRYCEKCGADWQDGPIPQKYIDEGYYAPGTTHYSKRLAISSLALDRVIAWVCPICEDKVKC